MLRRLVDHPLTERVVIALIVLNAITLGLETSASAMGSIMMLLILIFYVFAVMATKLFGETHEETFGSIGASMLSLFQVMTLDAWSDGLMRPMLEKHPHA